MLSDQPIQSAKEDLLGRAGFARQIASALLAAPPCKKASFAMGLCGAWGSGKTSILNMVLEKLQKKKGRKPVVLTFNPWQYPADGLLPGQFIQAAAAALSQPERSKKLRKTGKALAKYASALQMCTPEFRFETVAELRGKKKKKTKDVLPRSVLERKAKAARLLKRQKQKIFVIMDDIDRLPAARIAGTLQLIKAMADFPRFVYLLAYDEDVVIKALDKEMHGQGFAYLKKFMQAQFAVPAPGEARLRAIVTTYVGTWLKMQPELNYDRAYHEAVLPHLLHCFATIRDVYRFVNTFRLRYQALGNEGNFTDQLVITALQLHSPKALNWIQAHRDDLLRGGGPLFRSGNRMQKKRLQEEHLRLLSSLSEDADRTVIPLLGLLFPRYGQNVLDMAGDAQNRRLVRLRRICCEEFFDLYFTQSTDGLVLTQREILDTLRETEDGLRAFTDGLQTPERRGAYLTHLLHYLNDIPPKNLPVFFHEMLWLSRLPEGKTPTGEAFQRSLFHECCTCALGILAEMPRDMRLHSLEDGVSRADRHTIPALIVVLTRIRDHAPEADHIAIDEDILRVSLRQLLTKIHAVAMDGGWLTSHRPLPVLEFWRQADAVSFRAHLQNQLQNPVNAAYLISALTQRFDTGENMEYQYGGLDGRHAFMDEFPRDQARDAMRRLRGTDAFRALPEDVRLDCVAFMRMDWDESRVSHREVLEALPSYMAQPAETEI